MKPLNHSRQCTCSCSTRNLTCMYVFVSEHRLEEHPETFHIARRKETEWGAPVLRLQLWGPFRAFWATGEGAHGLRECPTDWVRLIQIMRFFKERPRVCPFGSLHHGFGHTWYTWLRVALMASWKDGPSLSSRRSVGSFTQLPVHFRWTSTGVPLCESPLIQQFPTSSRFANRVLFLGCGTGTHC